MEYDSTVKIDGSKVRQLREKQKLTQLYVATAVGVTTDTISRWENKHYPTIKRENGLKLAEALSVSLAELLEEDAQPSSCSVNERRQIDNSATSPTVKKVAVARVLFLLPLFLVGIAGGAAFFLWHKDKVEVTAVRYLPSTVLPDEPFPVLVRVALPDTYDSSLMIREVVAKECNIVNSVPPLSAQDKDDKVLKWITLPKSNEFAVFYLLSCSSAGRENSTLKFSGSVLAGDRGDAATEVLGDNSVKLGSFHWADTNGDNVIDDYEMLSVYELFPEHVNLGINAAEIEDIWAAKGYRWHADEKKVEIIKGESE